MKCGCKIENMKRTQDIRYIDGYRYVRYKCIHNTEDWRQDAEKSVGFRKQCYNTDNSSQHTL